MLPVVPIDLAVNVIVLLDLLQGNEWRVLADLGFRKLTQTEIIAEVHWLFFRIDWQWSYLVAFKLLRIFLFLLKTI